MTQNNCALRGSRVRNEYAPKVFVPPEICAALIRRRCLRSARRTCSLSAAIINDLVRSSTRQVIYRVIQGQRFSSTEAVRSPSAFARSCNVRAVNAEQQKPSGLWGRRRNGRAAVPLLVRIAQRDTNTRAETAEAAIAQIKNRIAAKNNGRVPVKSCERRTDVRPLKGPRPRND